MAIFPTLFFAAAAGSLVPLPARLQVVADAVIDAMPAVRSSVADIGCDHGQLSAALATSGRCEKVFACDVSEHALQKASHTLHEAGAGAESLVALRLGDGLGSLTADDGVDTVCMAGLGVPRMVKILKDPSIRTVHTLVLQPVSPRLPLMALLRSVLRRRGYGIAHERFTTSVDAKGCMRPYLTVTATRGRSHATPPRRAQLLGTAPPLADPCFRAFLHHQRAFLDEGMRARLKGGSAAAARQARRMDTWMTILDESLASTESDGVEAPADDALDTASRRVAAGRRRGGGLVCCAPGDDSCQPSWEELSQLLPCPPPPPPLADAPVLLRRERHGWCVQSAQLWLALELKAIPYVCERVAASDAPCLVLPNGVVEHDSVAAIRALEVAYPTPPLWPPAGVAAADVDASIAAFLAALPAARSSSRAAHLFSPHEGFAYDPLPEATFVASLDAIEAILRASPPGPFFTGGALSAADVVAAPILERYAAQLPLLHRGLRARDAAWPCLEGWYDAMDSVGAYACRVRGDAPSWRKVLSTAPWWPAGWPPRGGPDERGDPRGGALHLTLEESVVAFGGGAVSDALWGEYEREREWVAPTAAMEAAAAIVRNAPAILRDAVAQGVQDATQGDEALRALVAMLLASPQSATPDAGVHVNAFAAYLDDRMCVPRDMGAPAAAAIRQLHRRLNVCRDDKEGAAPAKKRSVNRF